MTNNLAELSIYTHNTKTHQEMKKQCSICHSSNSQLLKLPDEFQQHAAKKGFISFYCCNCCQIVNFLL